MPQLRTLPSETHSELLLTRRLDDRSEPAVRLGWHTLMAQRKPVLLDLSGMPYADGRLVRFLVWCRGQAALHRVRWALVIGSNAGVHSVLERVLWLDSLPLFQNRTQAIQHLTAAALPAGVTSAETSPPSAVIHWRADPHSGEFQYVSANAEGILGDPPQRWLSDPNYLLERMDPRDHRRWKAAWEQACGQGLPGACDCHLTVAGETRRAQLVLLPPAQEADAVPQLRGTLVLLPTGKRATKPGSQPTPTERSGALARARNPRLNPVERAEALQQLKMLTGAPWKQIAREVGLSHAYVRKLVGVLKLEDPVRESLRAGRLPLRTALALKPLPHERQTKLARQAEQEHLTAERIRHPAEQPSPERREALPSVSVTEAPSAGQAARRLQEAARACRARNRALRDELTRLLHRE